ncbi:unnamed protein product, partial [Meganyctiphanes norvegica]
LEEKLSEGNPFFTSDVQGRIANGNVAGPQQFPWQAHIKVHGKNICGASIIGDHYILTAAHCVHGYNPKVLYVTVGDFDRSSPFEQRTFSSSVEKFSLPSGYSQRESGKDIAVLKLKRKIKFSSNIRPICLPPSGLSITGRLAIVSGWGVNENGRETNKLNYVYGKVLKNKECGQQYGNKGRIINDMVCLSNKGGDACKGDSGGPSVMENGGSYYQVGIVSFGYGSCGDLSLPGVYTRVTSYTSWIRQQMH